MTTQAIEKELEATKLKLKEEWHLMDAEVRSNVTHMKTKIKQSLDIDQQVRKHPVETLGVALLSGLALGIYFTRPKTAVVAQVFKGELASLKGILLTAGMRLIRDRFVEKWDRQFTGAYPRYSGAKSAVTGGPPEDMNEMPASANPQGEPPVHDGSDL